jgi:hypothetical protein
VHGPWVSLTAAVVLIGMGVGALLSGLVCFAFEGELWKGLVAAFLGTFVGGLLGSFLFGDFVKCPNCRRLVSGATRSVVSGWETGPRTEKDRHERP